ncbi:MAG: SCO family protein [Myxococcota bacterium]|nr:SCO family protein [Myxococcota bacterium]
MQRRTRWIVGGIGWVAVAVVGVALAIGARSASGGRDDELAVRMPIAPFELTDQDGHSFGREQLHGKVWVASFAFTSCVSICPMLTSQMANLQRRLAGLGDRVHFVTITVDPENDTPERLREYAERHHADLSRWSFLTGSPDQVRATLQRVFFVAVGDRREVEGGYDILHTGQLMLVDREGQMRGLYPTDAESLAQLERDIARLLAE